jgi:hypothetical protein
MVYLRALAYADWRAFLNGLRELRKSRARMFSWGMFGLFILLFIGSRVYFHTTMQSSDIVQTDYIVSGFLTFFFLSIVTGIGTIGLFRSRAEARFIIGSPVPPLLAVPYLQLRDALVQSWNVLFRLAYFFFIFAPRSLNGGQAVMSLLLALAGMTALTTVVLPRRLAPQPLRILAIIIAIPLAIVSAEPAIRGLIFQLHPSPELLAFAFRYLPAWHPGQIVLHPSIIWIGAALGVAACAAIALMLCSRDAYPELYALSMSRLDATERLLARRNGTAQPTPRKQRAFRSSQGRYAPAGLLIFVWKSFVEFRRFATGRTAIIVFVLILGAGFASSYFAPDALFYTMLINLSLSGAIIVSARGAASLALELRRPLFWLSHGSLLQRLAAICAGRLLQPAISGAAFVIGIALAGKSPDRVLVIGLGLPAYLLLMQSIGILIFSISPRAIDQKGPLGGLRVLLAFVSFIAPGVVYALVAWAGHGSILTSVLAADATALAEAAAYLVLAAARLDSVGDRLSAT